VRRLAVRVWLARILALATGVAVLLMSLLFAAVQNR